MKAYANGAAERVCDWIDRHFPRRRRTSLRNAKRLALVLALARAELANQADLSLYARIGKDRLSALPIEFEVRWRPGEGRGRLPDLPEAAAHRGAPGEEAGRVGAEVPGRSVCRSSLNC